MVITFGVFITFSANVFSASCTVSSPVTDIFRRANTSIGANGIDTSRVIVTKVTVDHTFVDVFTFNTVSTESSDAGTIVGSNSVAANCVAAALVDTVAAFVDVCTYAFLIS